MISLRRFCSWLAILAIAIIHATAAATPLERGEKLHNQYCTGCHADMTGGDGVALYTREQRRVHSSAALKGQVRRCASGKGLEWSDADVTAVAKYLNTQYYHFGQ
jgi:cytochrome c553